MRERRENGVAQALRRGIELRAIGHVDVVEALDRNGDERGDRRQQRRDRLGGDPAPRRRRDRQRPAHAHRGLEWNVGNRLVGVGERVDAHRLAALVGALRKAVLEIGKASGVAIGRRELPVVIRKQQHRVHPETIEQKSLGDRRDVLGRRGAGEVARELVQRLGLALAPRGEIRV